ncbi:MAG: hypothetical protein ACMXX9_00040 [Candidatus Woesearchaeota archaeon]
MPIFGVNQASGSNLPINQIKTMRAQGLDNNAIIQSLQREGFSVSDIFDAMNQVDMPGIQPQSNVPSAQNQQSNNTAPNNNMNNNASDFAPSAQAQMQEQSQGSVDDPSTEELVEAIIDEKWSDLAENISKVIEWKNATNDKVIELEQKFTDLKAEFDKVHKALLGKLDKYDQNIGSVNANVSAMEKTFSKMLPLFSENIGELSRVVHELKETNSKKK